MGMPTTIAAPPLAPRAALRWDVVRRMVAAQKPATVLELGCGLGAVGARLSQLAKYTAVEPDEQSFEVAYRRITPLGGTVINGDHHKAPANDPGYDMVCAFEVLEHIEDDAAILAEWLPLVRPGGHLLLSVPGDPERFGPFDVLVGHFRRYTAEQLRQRLSEAGMVDVQVVHYGWPLGYVLDSVRDRLARRRTGAPESVQERTHTSGRLLQPRGALAGTAIRAAIAPFAAAQRIRPGHGPGLVALATRPAA